MQGRSAVRPLILAPMLCAAGLVLQAQTLPAANPSQLTGRWQLDGSGTPENEQNWKRPRQPIEPVEPCLEVAPRQELDGSRAPSVPCPQASRVTPRNFGAVVNLNTLNTFGKTLIAPSLNLTFEINANAVTIDDEFFVPTSFALGWRGHRLDVPTGRSYPSGRMHYTTAVVKTRWEGDALVQDLSGTSGGGFKMTRVFKPTDDGRRLLMLIQIKAPKITPPVADITRVYVR